MAKEKELKKINLKEKMHLHFLFFMCIVFKYVNYGLLVKWLRRRPLTAETGVRLPYKLLQLEIYEKSGPEGPLYLVVMTKEVVV